ncbi:unnamed protein product [Closterium sp. NIES-54]
MHHVYHASHPTRAHTCPTHHPPPTCGARSAPSLRAPSASTTAPCQSPARTLCSHRATHPSTRSKRALSSAASPSAISASCARASSTRPSRRYRPDKRCRPRA